ncbi:hypothetical protein Bhyg_13283, partial [Pseudolycoriella hygida]
MSRVKSWNRSLLITFCHCNIVHSLPNILPRLLAVSLLVNEMTASNKSVACMLQRRAKLLHKDNKTVPAYNEAISNLGSFLGETVLNEMSPLAKGLMGLDEPLPVAP